MTRNTSKPSRIDELETKFDKLSGKIEGSKATKHDPRAHADQTRASIAKWFVLGHLFSLPAIVILSLSFNTIMVNSSHPDKTIDTEKIVPLVTSFIGSPVGFVLGYYFKSEEGKK